MSTHFRQVARDEQSPNGNHVSSGDGVRTKNSRSNVPRQPLGGHGTSGTSGTSNNHLNNNSGRSSYHFLFKACIVGDSGVGKTKLLQAEEKLSADFGSDGNGGGAAPNAAANAAQIRADTGYEGSPPNFPSVGFKVRDYFFDDCIYRLQYWDCPGNERYMNLTTKYCAGASGYILVFDLTNSKSFENVRKWYDALNEISDDVPKILVGNKDNCLSSPRQVPRSLADNFAKNNDMRYYETDALSHIRCDAVFKDLFLQMADGIPPDADPKEMLNKGVKLGPLLLSSKRYKHSLLTASPDTSSTSFSMDWF